MMQDTEAADPTVAAVALATGDQSGLAATAAAQPVLRWRLESSRADVLQRGYEIERAADAGFREEVLGSGPVESSYPQALLPGAALASREVAWVRVRVVTDRGLTAWSDPLRIEGSLYAADDWTARPISPAWNADRAGPGPVPLFRKGFTIRGALESARLYVTALGIHETWINGHAVSADLFDPGWTVYPQRHLFTVHDVTHLLDEGDNALCAAVADGWWRGNLTWMERRAVYGATTAFIAQLELVFRDGSRQVIATDRDWRCSAGGLVAADIYDGCTIDTAREPDGWKAPGFDDSGWDIPVLAPMPRRLEQRAAPAVRVLDIVAPDLDRTLPDVVRVDCRQNLTGTLRLRVTARGNVLVIVRHAEVLDGAGRLHTAPLRNAKATDTYRIGPGVHVLEPRFTYHGFRHAEISMAGEGELDGVEVLVIASDLIRTGTFRCSEPDVNQLWSNILWSQRGNFLAIPTDCPQRDERLGWTGDIQVFAATACTNFDARTFLASWLADLALEQAPDGNVPSTVPNVIGGHAFEYAGVGWSDAATLVPWTLYEAYADRTTLASQIGSMRRWVDWAAARLDPCGTWTGDFHLGDWLDPGAPPDKPEEATTDRDFIASSYLAQSARIVGRSLAVLGEAEDARRYAALGGRVAAATWQRWSGSAVRTQTGCAMAIAFDIAPGPALAEVGRALAQLVEAGDGRIATGFLGTPLILPALSRVGEHAAAYRLLLNRAAPGWLYQVACGATTMWERWDAIQPDGTIHDGDMADGGADSMISFNHYAYGSVGEWLYRHLAGIGPVADEPGYRLIHFAPQPGGGLAFAEASVLTPFGPAAIAWRLDAAGLTVDLTIPPGAEGRFVAPAGWAGAALPSRLGSGRHCITLTPEGR